MNKLSATQSPVHDSPTYQQPPTAVTQIAEGLQRYKFTLEQYRTTGFLTSTRGYCKPTAIHNYCD